MKIILEFNDEESLEADRALRANDAFQVINDLLLWFREKIKYGDRHELEPARAELLRLLNEENLNRFLEG